MGVLDLTPFALTPDQQSSAPAMTAQRDYAKALLYGDKAKGGGQFPVVQSWTQGVSNMVNALMGGAELGNADRREQGAMTGSQKPSFSEGPSSEGRSNSDGELEKATKGLSKEADAIASIESKGSGDYSAIGPKTRTGDQAYGKYQVMGANIPSWTREVLGKEMSPQEFLSNPQAQDKVFQTKFAQGGDNNSDRASVWFTGRPLSQGANRSDGYITGQQYVDRFNRAMGGPSQATPSTAMAFSGNPDTNSDPAVSAITSALRNEGGTQVAAGKPAPSGLPASPLPQPAGMGIYIDPKLVPQRPAISDFQMRSIFNNPALDAADKAKLFEQYRQQGQPVEVPYLGSKVIIDPHNPTRQQFVPNGPSGTNKLGDMERPNTNIIAPPGYNPGVQVMPLPQTPAAAGPRSEVAPPVMPSGAPAGPAGAPNAAIAANAPPQTPGPVAAPAPIEPKPVQVASADPAQAFAAAASQQKPIETAQAAPAAPLTKLAANDEALKQFIGPEMWDAYQQKKAYEQQQQLDMEKAKSKIEVDKSAQTHGVEYAAKKYDTLSATAQAARKQMPNIDLALAMLNDPNMHTGLLSGAQDIWARFKAAALGEANANAPNESFDKIMASTVLGGIKDVGGGQIRNAEIQLLGKANANRTNTDASNRAVLEVSRRALQTTDHLDQIGQAYASGDAVIDPISGKEMLPANIKDGEIAPRHGLDVGYDKLARKFVIEHPSFTPDEIKHYSTIFDTGRDPAEMPPAGQPGQAITPKVGDEKQFKQGTGVWDGNGWVPKK